MVRRPNLGVAGLIGVMAVAVGPQPLHADRLPASTQGVTLTKAQMAGLKIYGRSIDDPCDCITGNVPYTATVHISNQTRYRITSIKFQFEIWTENDPQFPPEIAIPFIVNSNIQPMVLTSLVSAPIKSGIKDTDDLRHFDIIMLSTTGVPAPTASLSKPSSQLSLAVAVDDMTTVAKIAMSDPELIAKGSDPNGNVYLSMAAQGGYIKEVSFLLDHGASINQRQVKYFDDTPLIVALYADQTDVVRLLLQRHADVNVPDKAGRTAIEIADMLWRDRAPNDTELEDLRLVSDPPSTAGAPPKTR